MLAQAISRTNATAPSSASSPRGCRRRRDRAAGSAVNPVFSLNSGCSASSRRASALAVALRALDRQSVGEAGHRAQHDRSAGGIAPIESQRPPEVRAAVTIGRKPAGSTPMISCGSPLSDDPCGRRCRPPRQTAASTARR